MSQCIVDFGMFKDTALQNPEDRPNEHDYLLHLVLSLLVETCSNERTPTILPRIILNNLAMKLSDGEIKLQAPRHQQWALHIFHKIRSDLIPDFIGKLKVNHLVNESVLLDVTRKQLECRKYNDAALMIVRYKFHKSFDLMDLM